MTYHTNFFEQFLVELEKVREPQRIFVRSHIDRIGESRYRASVTKHHNGDTQAITEEFTSRVEAEGFVKDKTQEYKA